MWYRARWRDCLLRDIGFCFLFQWHYSLFECPDLLTRRGCASRPQSAWIKANSHLQLQTWQEWRSTIDNICCSNFFNLDWYFFFDFSRVCTSVLVEFQRVVIFLVKNLISIFTENTYLFALFKSLTNSADCRCLCSEFRLTLSKVSTSSWTLLFKRLSRLRAAVSSESSSSLSFPQVVSCNQKKLFCYISSILNISRKISKYNFSYFTINLQFL